ncbi:hypothetical protein LguiB_014314 [Lonicera macranthoides]
MAVPVTPLPEHFNTLPLPLSEQLCRPFSFAEILSATNNFDDSLVIGQGGFGKVYKGVIDNGASTVAIKRLSSASKQGDSEFRTEVEMLSKFRHSHIVSLIGYCYSSTETILVYEYMVNGSLADHLYKIAKYGTSSNLSWVQRLKICVGVARGLDYLHTGTSVQDSVIHRDVKSSNILLDKNCVAKVSDFGLSRINPIDQSCTHISTNVKGTTGYVDPEYMLTLRLTMKSDVYSFGVVLFEVLCGRRAVDFTLVEEQWSLARWAQSCIEKGTLHRTINPNLWLEILPESWKEFVRIANQCLCYRPKKRPTMTQVVSSLELALALQLGHRDSSAFEMAIEVQPMDDRKQKRELSKAFANKNGKITCDSELENHIVRNLYNGHATYRVTLSSRYNGIGIWEPATLAIKREGFSIERTVPSATIVAEKFSPSTIVTITRGDPNEFSIIGNAEHVLRANESSRQDISCSRDAIVHTMRLFARGLVRK